MNRNVRICLVFSFIWGFSSVLWDGGSQMPTFIFTVSHNSNSVVGMIESVQGMAQLFAAIPAGIIADRWRRDGILRLSSLVYMAAISMILVGVWNPQFIALIAVGMASWGMAAALNDGPMEALFADSTPTGHRSRVFSIKFALMMAGASSGGFISALIYWYIGNKWTLQHLQVVISAGLIIAIIPAVMQAFLRDEDALGRLQAEAAPLLNKDEPSELRWSETELRELAWVPYLLASSDLVVALGAGATVKFFGLYFINEFKLHPVTVAILLATTPMCTAALSLFAANNASIFGRANTMLVYHIAGTLLLYLFARSHTVEFAIPFFIARGAVMNCMKPLKRSMLMDVVACEKRGCWNSVESLTRFSWSGSAALGGLALDRWGYRSTFMVTAALYVVASIPLIALSMMRIENKLIAQAKHHEASGEDSSFHRVP